MNSLHLGSSLAQGAEHVGAEHARGAVQVQAAPQARLQLPDAALQRLALPARSTCAALVTVHIQ